MCIIVVKKVGVELPGLDVLQRCDTSNPDGAGFMYAEGGTVVIRKGFMKFNRLMDALKTIPDIKNTPLAIHFRIGTSGGKTDKQTHPFPVTNNTKLLIKKEGTTRLAIAHNGVIGSGSGGCSDTMLLIKDVLCEALVKSGEGLVGDILKYVKGNRFVLLNGEGQLTIIGDGWEEADGVQYSNSGYKGYKYGSAFNGYDWSDDFDIPVTSHKNNYTTLFNSTLSNDPGWFRDKRGYYREIGHPSYRKCPNCTAVSSNSLWTNDGGVRCSACGYEFPVWSVVSDDGVVENLLHTCPECAGKNTYWSAEAELYTCADCLAEYDCDKMIVGVDMREPDTLPAELPAGEYVAEILQHVHDETAPWTSVGYWRDKYNNMCTPMVKTGAKCRCGTECVFAEYNVIRCPNCGRALIWMQPTLTPNKPYNADKENYVHKCPACLGMSTNYRVHEKRNPPSFDCLVCGCVYDVVTVRDGGEQKLHKVTVQKGRLALGTGDRG